MAAQTRGARTRQVTEIFVITERGEEYTPSESDDGDNSCCDKALACIFLITWGAYSVAMTTIGILDYNRYPGNTGLAMYMIVQGATSVVHPILASCVIFCQCMSGKLTVAVCVITGLFNVGWGIFGTILLINDDSSDQHKLLHNHAVGFSVPLWIFFGFLICRYCSKDDDDDDD